MTASLKAVPCKCNLEKWPREPMFCVLGIPKGSCRTFRPMVNCFSQHRLQSHWKPGFLGHASVSVLKAGTEEDIPVTLFQFKKNPQIVRYRRNKDSLLLHLQNPDGSYICHQPSCLYAKRTNLFGRGLFIRFLMAKKHPFSSSELPKSALSYAGIFIRL